MAKEPNTPDEPPTAVERTGSLFGEEPVPEPVEKRSKDRSTPEDLDAPMIAWVNSDVTDPRYRVRVAKYRNGHRGIQTVRVADDGRVASSSCVLLTPVQYFDLAQCIFRDSGLVKQLLLKHPKGTHEIVDRIRELVEPLNK